MMSLLFIGTVLIILSAVSVIVSCGTLFLVMDNSYYIKKIKDLQEKKNNEFRWNKGHGYYEDDA